MSDPRASRGTRYYVAPISSLHNVCIVEVEVIDVHDFVTVRATHSASQFRTSEEFLYDDPETALQALRHNILEFKQAMDYSLEKAIEAIHGKS